MATLQKLPNGNVRALVRRNGISKTKVFPTKAAAQAWAAQIETAILGGRQAGTLAVPASLTLAHLIDSYIKERKPGRSALAAIKHVSSLIGHVPLNKLSAIHMNELITTLRKRNMQGVTLVGYLAPLSSALKFGRFVKNLDIEPNLAKEARTALTVAKIVTRGKERDRLPTDDELERLIDYFDDLRPGIPMSTIVRFACSSGMRLSEITGVLIEDIDWNGKSILIRQRKHPTKKLSNDQRIPLFGDAYSIASEIYAKRKTGRLFPYQSKSVGTSWQRACKALAIDDLHFHDLRHYALTQLFKRGLPIQIVALVSGHSEWRTLKRYTQLTSDDFHAVYEKVDTK